MCTSKTAHAIPLLCKMHWLPVYFWFLFKVLVFIFKAIHGRLSEGLFPQLLLLIPLDLTDRACYRLHWLGTYTWWAPGGRSVMAMANGTFSPKVKLTPSLLMF